MIPAENTEKLLLQKLCKILFLSWTDKKRFFFSFSGANYGADDGALGVNYWLPALLVGWNTFVSRIIFAFLLPLLLTAPFGIYSFLKPHVKIDLDKNPNDTEDPNTEEESNLER